MSITGTLPNPLLPDATKDSQEYGLNFMQITYQRWTTGTPEGATQRRNRYEFNRLYAMGRQPTNQYKDILDLDGEISVINLDFSPLPIAIPFINRKIDGWMQRNEKITCNAIDPFTQTKREKARADALFKLKNKEKIQAVQQEAGMPLEDFSDDDPKDEQELLVEFGFNYKEREEVIMEQGIDLVFYDNHWSDVVKERILKDLMICGVAMIRPYIDPNGRIKVVFELPENIISSYTNRDDFEDCQYKGRITQMSIMDIRLLYPNKISEEDLFKLAFSQKGINGNSNEWSWEWNPNYNYALARPYDGYTVTVSEMSLETLYNLKYKVWEDRFGTEKLTKVDMNAPEEEGAKYITSKSYYVEYFGRWIVNTKYLLEWGLAKNMVKPQDNVQEIVLPWVIFMYGNNKMTNTPMLETMIPSINIMQLTWLQQQKIIAAAAPDGFRVDISTMSDITLGKGLKDLSPFDLFKIYKQTGIQYYKGQEDSGEGKRQAPIEPANVPFSNKLEQLMAVWNAEYDKLLRITGSNDLAEGQISNQAVGKQVVQDARQISESASNYIYAAYLNMMKQTAKLVQMRLWDILVYGKKEGVYYYDGYRQALGTDRVEYIRLEGNDDFEKCQFDVKIEAVLDDNEANLLEQNIQMCLSQDTIDLQDAIEVRLVAKSNLKYASYLLASRHKKRQREKMEEAAANNQANTQQAIAASESKGKQDQDLEKLKAQLASQAKLEEIEALKSSEIIKFVSIAKVETLKSILNKEGGSMAQVPAWVLDGIPATNFVQTQLMAQQAQDLSQQQVEEQQMQQEQMAQMQQQEGQPLMAPEQMQPPSPEQIQPPSPEMEPEAPAEATPQMQE